MNYQLEIVFYFELKFNESKLLGFFMGSMYDFMYDFASPWCLH